MICVKVDRGKSVKEPRTFLASEKEAWEREKERHWEDWG